MGLYTFLTLLVCVVFGLDEASTTVENKPTQVKGYNSYLDVTPVKYYVQPGTFETVFSLQTLKSSPQCPQKTFDILFQHGGLPHVFTTNFTFPSNFLVDSPYFKLQMKTNNALGFKIYWPPPGSWFVIAYSEKTEKSIKQKGLSGSDSCFYFYMSSMESVMVDNTIVIDYKEDHKVTIGNKGTVFRFSIPPSTMSFTVQVTKCEPSPCNLTLLYQTDSFSRTKTCTESPRDCTLHVSSPSLMYSHHVEMRYETKNQTQNVTFTILVTECEQVQNDFCVFEQELDRFGLSIPFVTQFLDVGLVPIVKDILLASVIIVPFEILDPNDIGGTLMWAMAALNYSSESKIIVQICGGLLYNYLPEITSEFDLCTNVTSATKYNVTSKDTEINRMYVPYPKAGIWNILLHADCFDYENGSETTCPSHVYLEMMLGIQPCLDGGCSDKGDCVQGSLGGSLVAYTACQCDADYQGYACTDDTRAQSDSYQLAGAYLLTMSNLFFIPAIFIAIKKRYILEAVVYLYNMFFSTFYHACDGSRLERYRLCISRYNVLQTGDFFGSACSLWFTLMAMACIRYKYITPVLQLLGPFCILIGVVYDKTSLYVIAVPAGCGFFVIILSWGLKMYKRKKLYPSWRRYVFYLLPGLILAAVGAAAFSFFETETNYQYVHSLWHMCMALSICFFLPPRHVDTCKDNLDDSNISSQLILPNIHIAEENNEQINSGFVNETN